MKIERMIGILSLLLQKEKITTPELAERFEVSKRTILRDVDDLCKAGIPICTMPGIGGGIQIMDGYRMDRTVLTSKDMKMILAGLRSLDSVSGNSYYSLLMEKIKAGSSDFINGSDTILIDLSSPHKAPISEKVTLVQTAIDLKQAIRFDYYSPKAESTRILDPYYLIFKWSSWYVWGYCRAKQDFRMFKLNRMDGLEITDEQIPDREIPFPEFEIKTFFPANVHLKAVFDPSMKWQLIENYSYLVGQDEPCHTAIDRFRRFIDDGTPQIAPTLDEIEDAFSVEAVTNEFFNLYCDKFKQLLGHLEDNEDFVIEAQQHNFTAAQFAKKLMGQIVFLYFLQKKGWLGVGAWPNTLTEKEYKNAFYARGTKSRELIPIVYHPVGDGTYKVSGAGLDQLSDEDEAVLAQCVKGKPWGSGPHNFMRKLFEIAEKKGANFFDDYLEPLFYDALNVNRGEQGYDPALHCRIPFLSGGLFEPIDGYDWKHNDFAIPNEVFSNRINNNPRTGDGILDIFDRYNFTMSEDEPLEREVAIDPEMLGKVFENLLEVNDRKSKGAFYTPREIVHYMCQESLINYLTNTLQVSETSVRDFILYGDFMKDEDTVKDKRQGNGGMYVSEELYKIDSEGNIIVDRLHDMDKALTDVRVADPAVGSGAFPLGMLNEIVKARQNISAYFAITMSAYDARMMYSMERSAHSLKYETIRNCIYAADIEPSAVDIAQLRLWLSLVIDDEINPNAQSILDGHRNPLPLPNLECNILCGNSLVDRFEGIQLINASELIGTAAEYQQQNLAMSGFDQILTQVIEKQNQLFMCDNTEKKEQLLSEIADLRDLIIMHQMQGCTNDVSYNHVCAGNAQDAGARQDRLLLACA